MIVRKGDPVQIREATKAKIWVFDKNGQRIESEAVLPVGWYAIDAPESKNE